MLRVQDCTPTDVWSFKQVSKAFFSFRYKPLASDLCECVFVCVQHSSPSTSHWWLQRLLSWWHFWCCWWIDVVFACLCQWVIVVPFTMGTELLSQGPLLMQSGLQRRSQHSQRCKMQQYSGRCSLAGEMTASRRRHDHWHSALDILVNVLQHRQSSVLEILSSSSHRVMVVISVNQP